MTELQIFFAGFLYHLIGHVPSFLFSMSGGCLLIRHIRVTILFLCRFLSFLFFDETSTLRRFDVYFVVTELCSSMIALPYYWLHVSNHYLPFFGRKTIQFCIPSEGLVYVYSIQWHLVSLNIVDNISGVHCACTIHLIYAFRETRLSTKFISVRDAL